MTLDRSENRHPADGRWNHPRLEKIADLAAAVFAGGTGLYLAQALVHGDQFFVGLGVAALGAIVGGTVVMLLFALVDKLPLP